MRHAKTALKLLLVTGLLYFLGKKGFLSLEATGRAFTRKREMATAFACLFTATLMGMWRWRILLRAQGISLPFSRIAELNFVGMFFNIALPGAVSGDFVKAFYVGKESEGRRAHAFSSILFDRVTGLAGLILVSSGSLLVSLLSPYGSDLLASLEYFVLASGAAAIAFYGYLFLVPDSRDLIGKTLRGLEGRVRASGSFVRIYEGIRVYRQRPREAWLALGMSLVIHGFVICAFLNFAAALGETSLATLALFVVVPLGLLVTAIPVTPAGVGTGHAAYLALFHLLGSERGADVFSLYVLMNLFLGAIGGLIYLRFRAKESPAPSLEAS